MNVQTNLKRVSITKKKIKGIEYLYFTYYDSDASKKKEVYCGSAVDPIAKRKALDLELKHIKNKISDYSDKAMSIEKQISKIK